MAIVFPKSTYPGLIFSAGENKWTFDGTAWNLLPPDQETFNTVTLTPGDEPTPVSDGILAVASGENWDPAEDGSQRLMVRLDDTWKTINTDATVELPVASTEVLGGVKIDGNTIIIEDGVITALAGGTVELTNGFETISVSGQDDIVATSSTDVLTFVAGDGISITTDPETDEITITNSGIVPNGFGIVSVNGQTNIEAASDNDTLTLVAGTGISISTNAETGSITINSTTVGGSSTFNSLSDATSASLTIDEIYLPAITRLDVTNVGATAYRFDQYGTVNNPTIYAINGTTIAFKLLASGHPFKIQNGAGIDFSTGLTHVSTTGVVSTGANAQGKDSGTLYWKIPDTVTGGYRYQCGAHAPMVGSITVKNFGSL